MTSIRPWLVIATACTLLACDDATSETPIDEAVGGASATSSTGGGPTSAGGSSSSGGGAGGGPGGAPDPLDSRGVYFYGHSLVDWGQPNTQVGTAMCDVAAAQGHACCADGQWPQGLAPSTFPFFTYPPEPGQGHVPGCGQDWGGSFAQSGVDAVVVTEANFIQGSGPDDSIAAASAFLATLRSADPDLPVYLYEHWPELEGGTTFESWKAGGQESFHDWFVALQDGMNAGGSGPPVRLVPVGPLLVGLLDEDGALADLTQADLFADTAPHGTPTTYFLAGLVHYMALYRRAPATDAAAIAALPGYLHTAVSERYPRVVAGLWADLGAVLDDDGESRVW